MEVIRIQEQSGGPNGANAAVSFNSGPQYPVTISDPFSEEEEETLEWYFEEYLKFPFLKGVKVQTAVASIRTYGEALFKQVFAHHDAYSDYRDIVKAGLNTLQIEIAGSPQFHALHWEALKDPKLPQPLALQATIVRKNLVPQALPAPVRSSATINVLIVTARPDGGRDVGYRTISRPLVEGLRQTKVPVQIEILRPGTYQALEKHLREVTAQHGVGYYHVIHFDVHGAVLSYEQLQKGQQADRYLYTQRYGRQDLKPYPDEKAFLFFESERDNTADPVEAVELADLFVTHQIPLAMLNACQSGKQVGASETSLGSRLIQTGVQLVLAMGYSVTVSAAQLLMKTLYTRLFANDDLAIAIRHARTELYNDKTRHVYFDRLIDLEDWLLPVVYQNQPQRLHVREFTPEERAAYFEGKAEEKRTAPPEPRYGFVGRDLDILQIEKRLLTRRNLLLIQGMGGAGKTTLLRHLGVWWRTTGLVKQVFYFGYDEQAWNRQQILVAIAQQLLGMATYYRDFQPLSLDAQQALLTQLLRSEGQNHLLILDNLESITGTHLAIGHTLPPEEQSALHSFLTDLVGGHTLVLLGSRSREDWLAKGTFDDNTYDLAGLDDEAASTLADRILEKHHATKYRQDKNLHHLLKLLAGFPLALEVVLANLARQTPTEVLSALQAGEVSINVGESEKRTENILRCIDYSHSNLSPDAQRLLLCLAPFTSVIWQDMLDDYTASLRQQSALATLPFERWSEVIREARDWGLLSPDPDIPSLLRLQPILPYFLRNRLNTPEQVEVRSAVESAFRQHYDQLSRMLLYQLLESKDPQKRLVGQVITGLEYENLVTALKLALAAQAPVSNLYFALSTYLDSVQEKRRGAQLDEMVLKQLETYPHEKRVGPLGEEVVRIMGTTANRQFELKQCKAAETTSQRLLEVLDQVEQLDEKARNMLKAGTYHQLGMVAQRQRQWSQAEQYYQHALQIYIEYQDRYSQASTYHQLGWVAEEQRKFQQARDYFLIALETFAASNDTYSAEIVWRSLGWLWQTSGDTSLSATIASALDMPPAEVETLLRRMLGNEAEGGQTK